MGAQRMLEKPACGKLDEAQMKPGVREVRNHALVAG